MSANVTLNIGAGSGISVAADSIAVDSTVIRTTGAFTQNGSLTIQSGTNEGFITYLRANAAANNKRWRMGISPDNSFSLSALTDAGVGSGYFFRFTRGGVTGNEVQTFDFMNGASRWGSINNITGRLALGLTTASYRLDLPNTADVQGRGRSNQWVTYSDGRIKTDREPIQYGLKTVMSIEPLQYFQHNSFNDEDGNLVISDKGDKSIGLVAEDVEKIIPEIVTPPGDYEKDLYAIDYGKLTAVLIKAVQEQQLMIEGLEARLAALEV